MFEYRPNPVVLRNLVVTACLALLAGCGADGSTAATDSFPAAVQPPPAVIIAAAPTNLAATPGNALVTLTWNASSGATSYHVKRATTNGGPYTQVGAPSATTYSNSSVSNGTTYFYVVSALDSAGESANSNQVSALPAATLAAVPPVPAGLGATPGNALVTLTWNASSGATSYHVKRATTNGGPYTQVGAPSATTYSDSSVTNGTTYFYVISALDSAGESANSTQISAFPTAPASTPTSSACGMQLGSMPVIFCDTFDTPSTNGVREGQLDSNVWGVSRAIGTGVNFGQQEYNQWNATQIQMCDGSTPTVVAPHDIVICNGQVREATNDNNTLQFEEGTVTSLAMYPKQPFDFAGRTGTVSFDVSNDSTGIHSVWPEVWLSDAPVPDPFTHFGTWEALPQNGFGVRFADVALPGTYGNCPNANNFSSNRWTVDSAVVSRNFVEEDISAGQTAAGFGVSTGLEVNVLDCVISSTGPGNMNHVELRIAQNQIDVYATDAGVAATPTTLRHIASITGANLTFTRGLVWLEDAHYNADKQTVMNGTAPTTTQRQHTFSWDNLAFDGPFTDRDFAYDAPDNTAPGANGSVNLGQFSAANQTSTWNVAGIPANPQAAAAKVLFSFFGGGDGPNPSVLNVIVNGNRTSVPWPYPDQVTYMWRTFAVQVPLAYLVAGTNVVQLGGDQDLVFANVDLVLGDVTGGVPVLPGADDAYP